MAEEPRQPGGTPPPQDLVAGVNEVMNAALNVGASLARVVAEATSAGRPLSTPAASAGPLNAIVHYGIATVTNVAGMVLKSVGGLKMGAASRPSTPAPDSATATAAPAAFPRVHQGATLRIPLSIENPGEHPMSNIAFQCSKMTYLGRATGPALQTGSVRLQPQRLDILPRDFEKLTLFIDTQADTTPGRYRAGIATGPDSTTIVDFEVIPGGG